MQDHHHQSQNIKVAFFLNLVFTIIEIFGGIYTNSVTILSDALHDFGDTVSLGLSWRLEKYAAKKGDANFTYGYRRFSLLGAFINGTILILGSIFILIETIPRLWAPVQPDAQGMFWLSILGILFNGAAVLKLQSGVTMNEKTVRWHLLEDVFGWIVVLLISVVMQFYNIPILDPLFSLGFTLFILYNVIKNFNETTKIFLQAKPSNIDMESLKASFLKVPGLLSIRDIHIWSLDGEYDIMTLHVVLNNDENQRGIRKIKESVVEIAKTHKIQHVTIEIEHESEKRELADH